MTEMVELKLPPIQQERPKIVSIGETCLRPGTAWLVTSYAQAVNDLKFAPDSVFGQALHGVMLHTMGPVWVFEIGSGTLPEARVFR